MWHIMYLVDKNFTAHNET